MPPEPAAKAHLEIREIVAIDAVAGTRSFRLAAEAINTSQPTLSRLIASAEAKLNATLFRRGWSGAETTPRGDVAARACHAALAAIRATERQLAGQRTGLPPLALNLRRAHLLAVEAVLHEGSVTAAAARLGRSQPDLSRSLSDLSKRFGLTLFQRQSSGLVPTEAALLLGALLPRIDAQTDRLGGQLRQMDGALMGRVAVGVLPFSGQDIVSTALARLADAHPNLRLSYVPGPYNALVGGLRRGELDRLVGILRGGLCPADLQETPLYDEYFTVIARRDHPVIRSGQDPAQLAATHWVIAPHGSPVRAYFEAVFAAMNIAPPTQTCEIHSFAAAEELLVGSASVAMLSYSPRKLAALRPELRAVETPFPRGVAPIGVSRLRQAAGDAALTHFDAILAEVALLQEVLHVPRTPVRHPPFARL